MNELNEREQAILRSIVQSYIQTAVPVSSAQISHTGVIGLKPASVRRIMAGLEEKGFLRQPHTSAGRVPTTLGYRYFVDHLMQEERLHHRTASLIMQAIEAYDGDVQIMMRNIADVLARISRQLGIVMKPRLYQGIFERIQIVNVSATRLMIILSVKDGPVNTIMMEVHQKISPAAIGRLTERINRRFHGKTLREIKNSFGSALSEMGEAPRGFVRLFAEAAGRLFDFERFESYQITGTANIVHQPEFADTRRFSTLIELLEDKNIVVHLMEEREYPPGTRITIGREHHTKQIQECSVITSTFSMGNILSLVGVIGPVRMAYPKVIPLVRFTARALTERLSMAN